MIFDQHYMMFTIMENYDIVDKKQRYKSVFVEVNKPQNNK